MINYIQVHYLAELLCIYELNLGTVLIFFGREKADSSSGWNMTILGYSQISSSRERDTGRVSLLSSMGGTDEMRKHMQGICSQLSFIMILFLYLTFTKNNIWMKELGHLVTFLVVAVYGRWGWGRLDAFMQNSTHSVLGLYKAFPEKAMKIPHLFLFKAQGRGLHFCCNLGALPHGGRGWRR